jgi:hypothetical protein
MVGHDSNNVQVTAVADDVTLTGRPVDVAAVLETIIITASSNGLRISADKCLIATRFDAGGATFAPLAETASRHSIRVAAGDEPIELLGSFIGGCSERRTDLIAQRFRDAADCLSLLEDDRIPLSVAITLARQCILPSLDYSLAVNPPGLVKEAAQRFDLAMDALLLRKLQPQPGADPDRLDSAIRQAHHPLKSIGLGLVPRALKAATAFLASAIQAAVRVQSDLAHLPPDSERGPLPPTSETWCRSVVLALRDVYREVEHCPKARERLRKVLPMEEPRRIPPLALPAAANGPGPAPPPAPPDLSPFTIHPAVVEAAMAKRPKQQKKIADALELSRVQEYSKTCSQDNDKVRIAALSLPYSSAAIAAGCSRLSDSAFSTTVLLRLGLINECLAPRADSCCDRHVETPVPTSHAIDCRSPASHVLNIDRHNAVVDAIHNRVHHHFATTVEPRAVRKADSDLRLRADLSIAFPDGTRHYDVTVCNPTAPSYVRLDPAANLASREKFKATKYAQAVNQTVQGLAFSALGGLGMKATEFVKLLAKNLAAKKPGALEPQVRYELVSALAISIAEGNARIISSFLHNEAPSSKPALIRRAKSRRAGTSLTGSAQSAVSTPAPVPVPADQVAPAPASSVTPPGVSLG